MAERRDGVGTPTLEREPHPPAFGAPWVFVLCVIEGPDTGAAFRIGAAETVIGRDPGADVVLRDDQTSKRHCILRTEGGVCRLFDLESLNGTQLNGRSLDGGAGRRLRNLDEIQVGDTRLFVLTGKYRARTRT